MAAAAASTTMCVPTKAEQAFLDSEIPSADVEAAKHLRCTGDVNKLIHAYSKGLGEGQNRYGKGFGEAKRAMLQEECAGALYQTVQRTDKGTRMDACTEAAFDMFWNRPYDVKALGIAVYTKSNILRDNLLVMLTSTPVVGSLRARSVIHDKVMVQPPRVVGPAFYSCNPAAARAQKRIHSPSRLTRTHTTHHRRHINSQRFPRNHEFLS